ncbi:hypothetical protein [Nonlabens sp.]|uniref:hypothetical protein n=1 Tax=Nonlabens sp. TaxID=1888209 RepID=UPI001BD16C3C|nr:hypothetical protein [Nonlabens sp.]
MKNLTLLLSFIFSLTLLCSCESDDDDMRAIESRGSFSIDNDTFGLRFGFDTPVQEDSPNLYYKTILLSSEGYVLTQNNQLEGAADVVIMEVYSDQQNFEIEGTYSITDNQAVSGQVEMYFAINYDIQNDTLDREEDIESGTLTITKNENNTYVFTINNGVVDIVGNDFKLNYNGFVTTLN